METSKLYLRICELKGTNNTINYILSHFKVRIKKAIDSGNTSFSVDIHGYYRNGPGNHTTDQLDFYYYRGYEQKIEELMRNMGIKRTLMFVKQMNEIEHFTNTYELVFLVKYKQLAHYSKLNESFISFIIDKIYKIT